MGESSVSDFRLATIQLETSRQRVAKRPVNRKGTSFTYHQQPMNRITLAHPRASIAKPGPNMARHEGTPRAPRSGQIQNRHCSVRAAPFGGRGVRRSEDRLLKCWPELQICITQLTREGSPPPALALLQAKLPRNSSQIARGRIRRFESYMPSQPVRSLCLPRLASDGVSVLGLHP
jgi:hypothetical protein